VSFDECDANADGETSMPEYLALYVRHHRSERGASRRAVPVDSLHRTAGRPEAAPMLPLNRSPLTGT
jgi:hypothetical protein